MPALLDKPTAKINRNIVHIKKLEQFLELRKSSHRDKAPDSEFYQEMMDMHYHLAKQYAGTGNDARMRTHLNSVSSYAEGYARYASAKLSKVRRLAFFPFAFANISETGPIVP